MERKEKILIADDSGMNQEMLTEILGMKYEYLYANDGLQVVDMLKQGVDVDLILLDVHMPHMNGFDVLETMRKEHWIEETPVIVISADQDAEYIQRAFDLGATDYIGRPFNLIVVQRRVSNTLLMYTRQRGLVQLVQDQVYAREKINTVMINVLSHTIESRNNESGLHILHMRSICKLLLHRLVQVTDRYPLTESEISMISTFSALHDIGKISIPKKILNKPGKLDPEEWEIMKSHSVRGDQLLSEIPIPQSDPPMVIAHAICRWHHERWDGKGYPDGLVGDQIPISAQVVAMADVYDALTSERCYKKAFPHDEAIRMICNGECGAFNPVLIRCLLDVEKELKEAVGANNRQYDLSGEAEQLTVEALEGKALPLDDRTRRLLFNEQCKRDFFAKICGGIQFEYDRWIGKVVFTNWNAEAGEEQKTLYLSDGDDIQLLSSEDWIALRDKLRATTKEQPFVEMEVLIPVRRKYRWHRLTARTIWSYRTPEFIGAIGQFTDIHEETICRAVKPILPESSTTEAVIRTFSEIFEVVRLVDPKTAMVLRQNEDGTLSETGVHCYEIWGRNNACRNCTSCRALEEKTWSSKLEARDGKIFSVLSGFMKVGERECVMEAAFPLDENRAAGSEELVPTGGNSLLQNFYRDALTHAYSRTYLSNFQPNLEHAEGVALIDVDKLKQINDTYGHIAGDTALTQIANIILGCIRDIDTLIRYGGDEFLLIFSRISEEAFYNRLSRIRTQVHNSVLEQYPGVQLDVSVGGVYHVYPLAEAIAQADKKMYQEKSGASTNVHKQRSNG